MMTALRRIRAALVNGLIWGVAWGVGTVAAAGIFRLFAGRGPVSFVTVLPSYFLGGSVIGFLGGTGFSLALTLAFRNRTLKDVSVGAFTLVGAVAAAVLLPGMFFLPSLLNGGIRSATSLVVSLLVAAGLGGATAYGMIRLARAAPASLASPSASRVGSGSAAPGSAGALEPE